MAKQTKPKTLIVTRAELAELLAITPDSITRYVSQGMPVRTTGNGRGKKTTFDLRAALRWWMQADGDARERLLTLQADRIAFDLEVKRGAYILVDEAMRDGANVSRAVCKKLRTIPSAHIDQLLTIGAREGRGAAAAFLLARVDDALRELAALASPAPERAAS